MQIKNRIKELRNVKASELIPNPKNWRTHPTKQKDALKGILAEIGYADALLARELPDGKLMLLDGHLRAETTPEQEVPVLILDLTEEEGDKLLATLDPLASLAEQDDEKLAELLEGISTDNEALQEMLDGLAGENIEEIIDGEREEKIPEVEENSDSKHGEVYKLGEHRLLCGDSACESDVQGLMGDKKAKLLFTSPPYNMNSGMYENYTDNLKSEEYIEFNLKIFNLWKKYTDYAMWNISYNKNSRWEFLEILYRIAKETGFRFLELIVWDKGHGMPIVSKDMLTRQYEDVLVVGDEEAVNRDLELYYVGTTQKRAFFNKKAGKGITNYWKIGTNNTQLKNHLACFPVGLPAEGIKLMTEKNDIVIDCFGGSGSTLIACEQLNRKCYTCELDEHYCDVIRKRWAEYVHGEGCDWKALTPRI